jgi:hypothetical protein
VRLGLIALLILKKGHEKQQGHHSSRRIRHTPAPLDPIGEQAAYAGVRQAHDLTAKKDPNKKSEVNDSALFQI